MYGVHALYIWYDPMDLSMYLLVIDSLIDELILWLIESFTRISLDLLTNLVVCFQTIYVHALIYTISIQLIHILA